ncbi:MAG: hypothetical protein RML46_04860 [Anaerolineae bacterium]|nr:hypothetical protein [Anaerolineae bacterium]MDW8068224.1 hypothetical protein [Anaerolineae bacterium]
MVGRILWKMFGVLAGLVVLVWLGAPIAAAPHWQPPFPEEPWEYFQLTGHFVKGPFLEFFNQHGRTRILGYPQTEAFYDRRLGLWVQYFDNVRMEWHPGNPDPYKVQLGLLGEELGYREPPIPLEKIPRGNPLQRYFPETGHVVSYAFLTFYEQNGGLDVFGYPISEIRLENGRTVQYFQRTRLEWHPERPRGDRVVVGSLGMMYLQKFPVPTEYRMRRPPPPGPPRSASSEEIMELRVYASVRHPVTGQEGYQTVYLYVTDAARRPLRGVTAIARVRFPNGLTMDYPMEATNARGISALTFYFASLISGQKVVIEVIVQSGSRTFTAPTSFVVWY